MNVEQNQRRAVLSWLFVGTLLVLCGVLGVLQYRWIGEVSLAARDRLRGSLQASLDRLSRDFNSEIATACRALLPANSSEAEFAARYEQWKRTARHGQIFRAIAIAQPQTKAVILRRLDLETGAFETTEWPAEWSAIRERLRGGRPGPPPEDDGPAFDLPLFGMPPRGDPSGDLILDLNLQYVRDVMLPELIQRHLGSDYQVEVVTRATQPSVIYQSDPDAPQRIAATADASAGLFEVQFDQIFRPEGPSGGGGRGGGRGGGGGRGRGPGSDAGRWQMFVRHRAGSLEAVVAQARWRNLAVTAGVLLLMVASVAALVRFTRRAQKLAELQMEFVAGVSHELRTPLAVIHTAAYNLRGAVAQNPSQVERYGVLIQRESGRLKELVEQVLQFAGAKAGWVIQEPEPLSVETVVEAAISESQCVVEKRIDRGLPPILGDPVALQHALQNLIGNAAKYGTAGGNWIGVFASQTRDREQAVVEIRVADRGPGIPEDEQKHIFEPFFRGRRAVEDQIHGAGLGLNLAKKIVEAHGGSIRVQSEPMKGTEFTVRIPAAPAAPAGASA
ncbi:MAG: HAMP domain-containing sensor histidine kinase [Bryobacteraceae bacterium]|jgi:signal transduction histidine kinase